MSLIKSLTSMHINIYLIIHYNNIDMNLENEGAVIAKINGTKKKLYVSENNEDVNTVFQEMKLPKGQSFQVIPDPEKERQILLVIGASNSGKSYFTAQYCEQYQALHKKNQIYLFSSLSEDPSIDKIKNLKRIDITNEEFTDEPIDIVEFANSCIIFDDCEVIKNKKLREFVEAIADQAMIIGRHDNITVIMLSHTACNGNKSKQVLNECTSITIFLRTMQGRALKYLAENYLQLDKEQIKKLKGMKKYGRALTITKTYPQVAITEQCAYVLELED